MGNCLRHSTSTYNIEVVPPSEDGLEELPPYQGHDWHNFKIPGIVQQRSVRRCFKKNIAMLNLKEKDRPMLSLSKPKQSLILSTEDTE